MTQTRSKLPLAKKALSRGRALFFPRITRIQADKTDDASRAPAVESDSIHAIRGQEKRRARHGIRRMRLSPPSPATTEAANKTSAAFAGYAALRIARGSGASYTAHMNDDSLIARMPLRRVGTNEGAWHVLVFAAVVVSVGRTFEHEVAYAVPPAAGVFWAGWYGALRAARVRDWFGRWDAVSFGFVASYAVVVALALQAVLLRWV